jgi:hypothetical protein
MGVAGSARRAASVLRLCAGFPLVGQGARVLLVEAVLGLLAAAASTRALRSFLFEVGALDPMTFAACWLPW